MNSTYWINHIMSTTFPSSGATGFYLGLSSTSPAADGSNISEPNENSYSRVAITSFNAPVNGVVTNKYAVEFPQSAGAWFTQDNPARYWVLFDGSGAGAHVLSSGSLLRSVVVLGNAYVTFGAGTIKFTLTDRT